MADDDTASDRLLRVYLRRGGCCTFCGRVLRVDEVHLDHDHPESHLSVEHVEEERLHCVCGDCRSDKGSRNAADYRAERRARHARQVLETLAG